ncbi:unnamed protein product [Schistosoma curassoni]|uniref:Transposase n=1 Tax=Schistosoma curassoni TaxID=6186 RepID=A0A183KX76_9TREM|nr:unnamed protein product [Schistosoma curassoni]
MQIFRYERSKKLVCISEFMKRTVMYPHDARTILVKYSPYNFRTITDMKQM